jgi:sulfite reductase (NADPH) flavoprotein alpha-component
MFYYFGYGSNLSRASRRAKGVESSSAEPALLEDWRLAFNIASPFPNGGCFANVVRGSGAVVHGALCAFEDQYLERLDWFEACGVVYERLELEVRTYQGKPITAHVYAGPPTDSGREGRPSVRYRNILLDGGRDVGLADEYLDWLMNHPVHPDPQYPPFVSPTDPEEVFTLDQVATRPLHTALAGHVFDMSGARSDHHILRPFFEGRDVTLFLLQRMDSSAGTETAEDIAIGRLSDEQRCYLNDYLHEFSREYQYVGRVA